MGLFDRVNWEDIDKPRGDFEPLPAGSYRVVVTECETKSTKNGTGRFVAPVLEVTGPTLAGRKLFPKFNILNDSSEAMQIGLGQFKAFITCAAHGDDWFDAFKAVGSISEMETMLASVWDVIGNMALDVKVGIKAPKSDSQYGPEQTFLLFKAADGGVPAAAPKTAAAPAAGKKPWQK